MPKRCMLKLQKPSFPMVDLDPRDPILPNHFREVGAALQS